MPSLRLTPIAQADLDFGRMGYHQQRQAAAQDILLAFVERLAPYPSAVARGSLSRYRATAARIRGAPPPRLTDLEALVARGQALLTAMRHAEALLATLDPRQPAQVCAAERWVAAVAALLEEEAVGLGRCGAAGQEEGHHLRLGLAPGKLNGAGAARRGRVG